MPGLKDGIRFLKKAGYKPADAASKGEGYCSPHRLGLPRLGGNADSRASGRAGCGCTGSSAARRTGKKIEDNLFIAVRTQIEGNLLWIRTLIADAEGNLFATA